MLASIICLIFYQHSVIGMLGVVWFGAPASIVALIGVLTSCVFVGATSSTALVAGCQH